MHQVVTADLLADKVVGRDKAESRVPHRHQGRGWLVELQTNRRRTALWKELSTNMCLEKKEIKEPHKKFSGVI